MSYEELFCDPHIKVVVLALLLELEVDPGWKVEGGG